MKACIVFAILLVAFVIVSSAAEIRDEESLHTISKRETIRGPDWPHPCVFYECMASCRQRGYKSGGICTLTGCHCLR